MIIRTPYEEWRRSIRVFASAVHMIAGTERWRGDAVTVPVCRLCGYWPINGEEVLPRCKRCNMQGLPDGHPLKVAFYDAAGIQSLIPARITARPPTPLPHPTSGAAHGSGSTAEGHTSAEGAAIRGAGEGQEV